jgi:hypothetical protein
VTEADVWVQVQTRPTSEDRLVRRIRDLERRVSKVARTPQLTSSAIDDGAVLVTVDGQTTGILGQQYDGTTAAAIVAGPTPPIPAGLTATAVVGGIRVTWDGTWQDPQTGFSSPVVAPQDFARVIIQVSTDVSFTGQTPTQNYGALISPAGGSHTVSWPTANTPLYVRLRAVSQAGKVSTPSLVTGPISSGAVGLGDLGFNLANYTASNTILYSTTQPANPDRIGALWVKEVSAGPPPKYETWRWTGAAWVLLQDTGVSSALVNAAAAQTAADTKAKLFVQSTTPTYTGAANTAYWIDTTSTSGNLPKVWSGSAWTAYKLGNGAIQANSLVASNVIATGTVTAALLEALMVLATTIIAGDPDNDYAAMRPDGFHVYANGLEVIRMGTTTNDYFAVVNAAGTLVANIDDTGRASFAGLTVTADPVFQGVSLSAKLAGYVGASPGRFSGFPPAQGGGSYGPIINRVGIAEVNGYLTAGRDYQITWIGTAMCDSDDSVETRVYLQYTGPSSSGSNTAAAPNVSTSAEIDHWLHSFHAQTRWETIQGFGRFSCTTTGRHRFLLASERGALGRNGTSTAAIHWRPEHRVSLVITDIGPTSAQTGQFTQASGAFSGGSAPSPPPTPTQQFYIEINRSSQFTYGGSGTQRGDTTDVVQGWDPSGYNGDGYGFFAFNNIPSITGTVDRVDVWMYFYHWYYNSGGTALINILKSGSATSPSTFAALKLRGNYAIGNWPKPGGVWVTLPSDWWPFFANAAGANKVIGVSLGQGGGTNELYYGRATDCSLRLWYTQ